jgi:hypothetical protein
MELSSSAMQLKHLGMEREILEMTWRQKVEAVHERNKELTKEL